MKRGGSMTMVTLGLVALGAVAGCSADSGTGSGAIGGDNVGVTQGGAQDFGLFRQILESGGIPGPETIDDVGFFAEHKLDYPDPLCGEDMCMHGMLGAMGNMITGSSCTVIQIGLNSPIDLSSFERPPMHLVLAVDVSGSMGGAPIGYVRTGLANMISELEPTDLVSLVTYSSEATVVLDGVSASDTATLQAAFAGIGSGGSTNIFDGLFTAYALAQAHADPAWQNRVLLLSDGQANTGIDATAAMVSLAESYAAEGIALSAIGVGSDFDVELMKRLGEVGGGNFYFLEDPQAVLEVFTDEVKTFLYPLALDARIDVSVASGYSLRGAYGTKGFSATAEGGTIEMPALFLAGRTSASEPIAGGRRGGGGAILLELVPSGEAATAPHDVGSLALSWRHPTTGALVSDDATLVAPHAPDAPPAAGWFSDTTVEKGFVMLNLYAGFELATSFAADGDPWTARRTLEALYPNVAAWLATHDDADIADDLHYVELFITNLSHVIANLDIPTLADPPPADPWPYD